MFKKVVLGVLALVVLVVSGAVAFLFGALPKSRPAPEVHAPTDAATVARGRYLANHVTVCLGCHSETNLTIPGQPAKAGRLGSGRLFIGKNVGFPGNLAASNLTPDKTDGIGAWTDGEVLRAMREGVSRDGRALFPMMPYLTYRDTLTDEDALAIIAYLRTLEPISGRPGKTELDPPLNVIVRTMPAPLEKSPPAPAAAGIERGRWLLRVASCKDCHDTVDDQHNTLPGMEFAGGGAFPIPGKGMVYARNITSDPGTGLGGKDAAFLRAAIAGGIGRDGKILYEMPWIWYQGMSDTDMEALILAVQQIAPVVHEVPLDTVEKPEPAPPAAPVVTEAPPAVDGAAAAPPP